MLCYRSNRNDCLAAKPLALWGQIKLKVEIINQTFCVSSPDEAVGVVAAGPAGSVLSQSAGHREEELTAQKRLKFHMFF